MEEQSITKWEFWQKAAAVCFGAWALMIPLGITMLKEGVGEAYNRQKVLITKFDAYQLSMERRVIVLEDRQLRVLEILKDLDRRLENVERNQRERLGNK